MSTLAITRFFQWLGIVLFFVAFSGGYLWYRSKAGVEMNAPEATNNTLASGLVGHWTFDAPDISGTTVTDRSTFGNNGTITGAVSVKGKLGQALSFNGTSDSISAGSGASLDDIEQQGGGGMSISLWVIAETPAENHRFIQKGMATTGDWNFYTTTANTLSFVKDFTGGLLQRYADNQSLSGGWHHLVVTWDGSEDHNSVFIYNNSVQVSNRGFSTTGTAVSDASFTLLIGRENYFDGEMDDVRIYNRVLSPSEVYQLYTAGTATVNAPVDDPLSQGLRGYWKLDEGTGTSMTADASGNANTLSMTGPPTWTTGTIGHSAMDFSGSGQYLSVASPSSALDFPAGANFSLTGWFNRDLFAADHTILSSKSAQTTSDGYIIWINNNAGNDYLNFRADENGSTDAYSLISATNLSATGWHHFAVSWNESAPDAILYIDGAVDGAASGTAFASMGDLSNANPFSIGAETDGGNPFDGKLDDIRVYGSALSAGEVAKLYQTTAPTQPVDTGLVGHWTFDGPDIQGTTAIDRSSFGNNGTITGALPAKGKLGQGMSFNGTGDYMATALQSSSLDNIATKTLSVWIYPNALGGTPLSKQNDTNGLSYWYIGTLGTTNNYLTYRQRFVTGSGNTWRTPTDSLKINEWQHIVIVYDNSNVNNDPTIFINGVSQTVTNVFRSPSGNTTDDSSVRLTFSVRGIDNPLEYFFGKLDDVRIYNRALTVTEIADLYNNGK